MWRVIFICLSLTGCSASQQNNSATRYWAELTRIDVEAAYQILAEDHPGFAKSVNDQALQRRVNEGRSVALARAGLDNAMPGPVRIENTG